MKNLCMLIVVALCVSAGFVAPAQTINADARFDTPVHDFGTIGEDGGKVTHRFRVTNAGTEPPAFLYARCGCGCVRAELPNRPIPPGESGYVTVSFNPAGRPGKFNKEINVVSPGPPVQQTPHQGVVEASPDVTAPRYSHHIGHDIYAGHKALDFGRVKAGKSRELTFKFTSDCAVTINLDFRVADAGSGVTVNSGYILPPEGDGEVKVTVNPAPGASGKVATSIIPVANGYKLSPIPVTYIAVP